MERSIRGYHMKTYPDIWQHAVIAISSFIVWQKPGNDRVIHKNCKNRISKVLNIRMLLRYHKAHLISNLTSSGSTPESEAGAPNKADIMARTSSVTWRKMNIICCFCDFIFLKNYLLLGSGSNHSATWPLLSQLAVHLEKGNTELLQNILLMAIR